MESTKLSTVAEESKDMPGSISSHGQAGMITDVFETLKTVVTPGAKRYSRCRPDTYAIPGPLQFTQDDYLRPRRAVGASRLRYALLGRSRGFLGRSKANLAADASLYQIERAKSC